VAAGETGRGVGVGAPLRERAVGAAPKPEKPHRFAVVAADRSLYLQADGEEELAAWMAAFRALLPAHTKVVAANAAAAHATATAEATAEAAAEAAAVAAAPPAAAAAPPAAAPPAAAESADAAAADVTAAIESGGPARSQIAVDALRFDEGHQVRHRVALELGARVGPQMAAVATRRAAAQAACVEDDAAPAVELLEPIRGGTSRHARAHDEHRGRSGDRRARGGRPDA
jgi:hypothetical protein